MSEYRKAQLEDDIDIIRVLRWKEENRQRSGWEEVFQIVRPPKCNVYAHWEFGGGEQPVEESIEERL